MPMELKTTVDGVALLEFVHSKLSARKEKLTEPFLADRPRHGYAAWAPLTLGS